MVNGSRSHEVVASRRLHSESDERELGQLPVVVAQELLARAQQTQQVGDDVLTQLQQPGVDDGQRGARTIWLVPASPRPPL